MITLPPPAEFWLPPKPAIIRHAPDIKVPDLKHGILPGIAPKLASNAPLAASYVTNATDSSAATTYTFSNHAIGAAATNRYILVQVSGTVSAVSRNITSITVGGSTPTTLATTSGTTQRGCQGFYIISIPTGTTATTVVTFDGSMQCAQLSVWRLTGLSSLTAVDTQYVESSSTTNLSCTINVKNGGAIFAGSVNRGNLPTQTWSGANKENGAVVNTFTFSSADATGLAAQTGRAVSIAWSGGSGFQGTLLAVSLR
ncbi:hypothetical protein [Mesorhizobium atlanticum]|uniref:Uncharacterized protein n=1 Tax=Mesorhizobium atlanticum TaxID=2233532 RepID=A0A330GQ60_9HYPH|nr:hypothetical protein [Mesorhizobium atlanticum]RAZ75849.1 hypothetical protein DPM35_13960 [Mesorhizobium atlanticum]